VIKSQTLRVKDSCCIFASQTADRLLIHTLILADIHQRKFGVAIGVNSAILIIIL